MIEKNHRHRGKGVKVTFSVPTAWVDQKVSVVGDFNDWDPLANPMRKKGDVRTTSIALDPGQVYRFRYLDARGHWFDDPGADDIWPSSHGSDSIVDLRDPEPEA